MKHHAARKWIRGLSQNSEAVVSTQVLQEFYSVATRKLDHTYLAAKQVFQKMAVNELVVIDLVHIETAIDLSVLNQISFFDLLIFSAAIASKCTSVLTEDLRAGARISGVRL